MDRFVDFDSDFGIARVLIEKFIFFTFRIETDWISNLSYLAQILCCENRKYLETVLGSDHPPARIIAARS